MNSFVSVLPYLCTTFIYGYIYCMLVFSLHGGSFSGHSNSLLLKTCLKNIPF